MAQNTLNLNMYNEFPTGLHNVQEIKRIIEERLKLYEILVKIESLSVEKHSEQWNNYLEAHLALHKLVSYEKLLKGYHLISQNEDHIAHWMLSLIYCKNDKLIESFIKWELEWFHARYQRLSPLEKKVFSKRNGYVFEEVSILIVLINFEEFAGCNRGDDPTMLQWYKTRFENLKDLLGTRSVYVRDGFGYFPEDDIIHLIKYDLRDLVRKRMKFVQKISIVDEVDEVVVDLLNSVNVITEIESLYYINKEIHYSIDTDNIDIVAKKHFPVCMKYIHEVLRKEHFLKYGCKMQLGVFLRNIGMPYEEALLFWRNEFLKTLPVEKYNKKYEYLFKHQFGKVGCKKSHPPDSCDYIIKRDPLPGQHHGCPFKHWEFNRLGDRLKKELNFNCNTLADIEDLVGKGQYRQACTKCFNTERNVNEFDLVSSPVEYSLKSMLLGCEPNLIDCFDDDNETDSG